MTGFTRAERVAVPYSVLRPPGTVAGCRDWNPNTRVTCGVEVKGQKDAHNGKKLVVLSWIITNLEKYIWCCLLKKNSLWCFLPCYSNLTSSSLTVGNVAGDAPVLLEGLAVGRGWKTLVITCLNLLVTGPSLTSRAYLINLIPALALWFLGRAVFYVLCSNSLNWSQQIGHCDWDEM